MWSCRQKAQGPWHHYTFLKILVTRDLWMLKFGKEFCRFEVSAGNTITTTITTNNNSNNK